MAYGLHLTLDQKEWRESDFSATNKLTGTIYTDKAKSSAKNLTGYTLTILIYKENGTVYFDKTATITVAANGTWEYAVAENEMAPMGIYKFEIELTKSGDHESTFPVDFLVSRSPKS